MEPLIIFPAIRLSIPLDLEYFAINMPYGLNFSSMLTDKSLDDLFALLVKPFFKKMLSM